jgi:hypothetical protein
MTKKICTKCNIEKDICEFRKDKTKKDGFYPSCKECKLLYRRKNNLQVNLSAKRLRDINKKNDPEKFYLINYERNKRYYDKNKKEIYFRKSKNITYRLNNGLRARIRQFLRSHNIIKNNTTSKIVGCSPEILKEHLEKQFIDNMCWENYGYYGWHIDHIIPLSSASSEEEAYKLCHYTNLQPLWGKDNLIKSNKIK